MAQPAVRLVTTNPAAADPTAEFDDMTDAMDTSEPPTPILYRKL